MVLEGKYIGLILAVCSSFLIGISFVITKKGLLISSAKNGELLFYPCLSVYPYYLIQLLGYATDSHRYLKNPVWWSGLIVMVSGEIMNFIGKTSFHVIFQRPDNLKSCKIKIRIYIRTRYINHSFGCIKCNYRVNFNSS